MLNAKTLQPHKKFKGKLTNPCGEKGTLWRKGNPPTLLLGM